MNKVVEPVATATLKEDWQPIDTAPTDGSAFQAKIPGHGSDNVIAWCDVGILPKTEYRHADYFFQREQSRALKEIPWEGRCVRPEPWYRIIGAASGYVALAYATWRMLPFLAAVVRAL